METKLVTMLKSYAADFDYVARLVPSYRRHNVDGIPLYVVVPHTDISLFEALRADDLVVIADEDVTTDYLSPEQVEKQEDGGGIANAGVVKLAFGLLNIAENYFAIDSDTVFIRDFGTADFLDGAGKPYLVASQHSDLATDPFYAGRYWQSRKAGYEHVLQRLQVEDSLHRNAHNCLVMSSEIIHSLKARLENLGMSFADAMSESLYEFFWYGAWALETGGLTCREALVRVIQHQGDHLALHLAGVRNESLAASYVGVTVNSNWSRQYGIIDFDHPPISRYLVEGRWAGWLRSQPLPHFGLLATTQE